MSMTRTAATIYVVFGVMLSATAAAHAGDAQIERTTVYKIGEGNYQSYRIPAAVVTPAGTLLAFCEGRQTPIGPGNDTGEINLIVKRSADNGKTFSESTVVWSDGKNTCGNPCAVIDADTKTIFLLMTHNRGKDHERDIVRGTSKGKRTVWITSSTDDGKTWATPHDITGDVSKEDWAWYATGPGVGIQLQQDPHKGRLVIPCDHVVLGGGKDAGNAHVIFSDDHGKTWKLGGEPLEPGFNESQIVELTDGRAMLNMRNYTPNRRAGDIATRGVAISDDAGETFKEVHHDATLVESICQASILRIGKRILFSNPADAAKRINMTLRISDDDAQTWPISKTIFTGPSAYSCLVALPDGSIGLLYECGEKKPYDRIEFARLRLP
jgi:sialidase-1